MPKKKSRLRYCSIVGAMLREDILDFAAELRRRFPGTVFFEHRLALIDPDNELFPDPLSFFYAKKRTSLQIEFRSPTEEELADGRPELICRAYAFHSKTVMDPAERGRQAGRYGITSQYWVPRFEEAIIPAFVSPEFVAARNRLAYETNYRCFDTEDSRYNRQQADWAHSLRCFDRHHGVNPQINFGCSIGNEVKMAWIDELLQIVDMLFAKTFCYRDLNTGEMVAVDSNSRTVVSRRIMDACSLDENLFAWMKWDFDQLCYLGAGPTDNYRKKVRKRAGV